MHSILIIALLCMGLGGAWLAPVVAQPAARIAVDPPTLELDPGETALFAVTIEGATDVYGYEVELIFDPNSVWLVDANPDVEGVQLQPGDWFADQPGFTAVNRVNNAQGTALYATTLLAPALPKSGQGSLIAFEVQGVSAGSSALRLSTVAISSIDGVLFPVDVQHGEVTVRGAGAAQTPTPLSTSGAPIMRETPTPQADVTPTPENTPRPSPTVAPGQSALPEGLWTVALVLLVGLPLSLLIRWASRRKRQA